VVYGWREGAKWGVFAPLYSLAGPQNRTYFDLSDSFCRKLDSPALASVCFQEPNLRWFRVPDIS